MARPLFVVHHLIACLDAPVAGLPNTQTPPARNLQGVDYTYRVPAPTGFPVVFPLCLYARFFLTNGLGGKRRFEADLYWLDSPGNPQWVATHRLGPIIFDAADPVVNAAWQLSRCEFPGRGRFEFRMMCDFEPHEDGFSAPVAVEPILIV